MSSRPAVLFPLFAALDSLTGVGPKTAQNFAGLNVTRPRDLLFTLPYSGIDRTLSASILDVVPPDVATVKARVLKHIPARRPSAPARVQMEDEKTVFELVFFRARKDYLEAQLPVGAERIISGKVEHFDGVPQITHPDHILPADQADQLPGFEPVYALTAGITQKTMYKASRSALGLVPDLEEWIDASQKEKTAWPSWREALLAAHSPSSFDGLVATAPARERLAYDEFFAHQLTLALARAHRRKSKGRPSVGSGHLRATVLDSLPYEPTGAQSRAVQEIAHDMAAPSKMNRLLQGDVGAGKTLVAFLALLIAVEAGGQGAMMAPTEILARQHMEGLTPLAKAAGIRLELLTGRDKGARRKAKLEALAQGEIDILVGTHALFQKDVSFDDLRLVIIDEQHRFGVEQRKLLGEKGAMADVLVMTATPIPRSLALAQHGDMDVSVLDEKPKGRQPIKTALMSTARIDDVTAHLKNAIKDGRQAYWVCPLVGESESVDLAAAEERFKALRAALGEEAVGLVHGQMPPDEKDAAMSAFQDGRLNVLVATTVIEVGVDVPNATIIVIERAESFGLAQLHQLRGRVGRGSGASTCLLLYQTPLGAGGEKRLSTLRDTEDGFRIAEVDFEMRGAGDVLGTAQSGLPRFRIADLERQSALQKTAQSDARLLLETDPDLSSARGQAARVLLWLLDQDQAFRFITVG